MTRILARIAARYLWKVKDHQQRADKIATMNILRRELGMPEYRGGAK